MKEKIKMAKAKLAKGPAATTKDLWYKGFVTKSFFWSYSLYFFNNSSCSAWLKTFLSPKNFTYPPKGIKQNFHLVPDLSLKPKISFPKPIEKSVTPTPYRLAK